MTCNTKESRLELENMQKLADDYEKKVGPCCDYYQIGMDKVNAPIILQSVRDSSYTYDGKPFVYCPWCGAYQSMEQKK